MADTNQCDGCMSGALLDDEGIHRAKSGHPMMVCQAHKYATPPADAALPDNAAAARFRAEIGSMQPADAALADADVERIASFLDDDAITLRTSGWDNEVAQNIDKAADIIRQQAAVLRARAVPIEWRRVVRELMTLTNFRPLCQKNVMDGCRCYDCVMARAGQLIDGQTAMLAASQSATGGG